MVKVVKNTGNQPIGHIKIKPNPVKVIKLPSSGEGSTQVNETSYLINGLLEHLYYINNVHVWTLILKYYMHIVNNMVLHVY